jgi:hypothetical protein
MKNRCFKPYQFFSKDFIDRFFNLYYNVQYKIIIYLLSRSYFFSIIAYLTIPFIVWGITITDGEDSDNPLLRYPDITLIPINIKISYLIVILYEMVVFGSYIIFSLFGTAKQKENFWLILNPFYILKKYKSEKIFSKLQKILIGKMSSNKVQKGSSIIYVLICFAYFYFAFFYTNSFNNSLSFFFMSTPFIVAIIALLHFLILISSHNNTINKNRMLFYIVFIRHALLGTTILSLSIYFAAIINNVNSTELVLFSVLFFMCISLMVGINLLFQTTICLLVYPYRSSVK